MHESESSSESQVPEQDAAAEQHLHCMKVLLLRIAATAAAVEGLCTSPSILLVPMDTH
jgi:hypothetical protein